MLKAFFALIGVFLEILVDAAKKLVGLAFLAALLTTTTLICLVLALDHLVG